MTRIWTRAWIGHTFCKVCWYSYIYGPSHNLRVTLVGLLHIGYLLCIWIIHASHNDLKRCIVMISSSYPKVYQWSTMIVVCNYHQIFFSFLVVNSFFDFNPIVLHRFEPNIASSPFNTVIFFLIEWNHIMLINNMILCFTNSFACPLSDREALCQVFTWHHWYSYCSLWYEVASTFIN